MANLDPTKISLAQAELLAMVAAAPAGLPRDGHQLSAHFSSLQAIERRGLLQLLTQPTGYDHPKWRQTWLVTDLGRQVLAGGLVHTDHEPQAGGGTRLLVFLNGRQAGEVKHDPECFPPLGRGSKWTAGWIGVMPNGDQREFERKAAAVAWVAGGAR